MHAQLIEQAVYSGVLEARHSGGPVAPGTAGPYDGAPPGPAQCAHCFKLFEYADFLGAHMHRRHPGLPPGYNPAGAGSTAGGHPAGGAHPNAFAHAPMGVRESFGGGGAQGAPAAAYFHGSAYYGAPGAAAESGHLADSITQDLVGAMAPMQPGGAGAEPYILDV